MKINIKIVFITAFLLVNLLPVVARAQDTNRNNSEIIQEVSLFFTFSKEKKAEKLIQINKNLYDAFNLETNEFSRLNLKNKIDRNTKKIKKVSSGLSGDIKELIDKELSLIELNKNTQIEEIVFLNDDVQDIEVIEETLIEDEVKNEVSIDKNIAKPTVIPTATSLPVVSEPVEKLTIENLKFTCSPYLVPDNIIRVGEEFKVKLTPNFGTIKDYNIAWISSAYKERYDNGIYSFRFLKTGKYGLAFIVEIKSTGEKKESECSVEVLEPASESDAPEEEQLSDEEETSFYPPPSSSISSMSCWNVDGASVFGYSSFDGGYIFIGGIFSEYNSDSIANEYGAGSEYKSDSIMNDYGKFGSDYSSNSAFNDYASKPPILVDQNLNFIGYLTTNKYKSPYINTWSAIACAQESYKSSNYQHEDITIEDF